MGKIKLWWLTVTDAMIRWGGRFGCRVLDRHHYAACRGRRDHQALDERGYPAPARWR